MGAVLSVCLSLCAARSNSLSFPLTLLPASPSLALGLLPRPRGCRRRRPAAPQLHSLGIDEPLGPARRRPGFGQNDGLLPLPQTVRELEAQGLFEGGEAQQPAGHCTSQPTAVVVPAPADEPVNREKSVVPVRTCPWTGTGLELDWIDRFPALEKLVHWHRCHVATTATAVALP